MPDLGTRAPPASPAESKNMEWKGWIVYALVATFVLVAGLAQAAGPCVTVAGRRICPI